ncbi:MAG: hypothetical protein WBF93_21375 [Pirellulales bacterium]|nr:hypothetical protein [Pirellulales bacterium]
MSADELYDANAEYEEIEEEISTDEVDQVLETLSDLMQNVESESVHEFLEGAYNGIFGLVYEEEEEDTADGASDMSDEDDEDDSDLDDELEDLTEIDDDDHAEAA